MARRMALVPEDVATSYFPNTPDTGVHDIENQILNLLHTSNYSDDAKAKLLSQLILKYQRVINEPPPPLRVTIEESKEQAQELQKNNTTEDPILRNIIISVPANFQKFIPPIVEKLNTRSYSWNEYGELTKDNEIVRNTNVIDLFSYLMRNVKKGHEPHGFSAFWKGIKEIKIPTRWIGNHKKEEKTELKKKMERILEAAYYDFANPASFGGVKKLSTITKVPYHKTKQWLSSQDTYSLHKPVRYKFSRRATLSYGINDLWQCDLVDLQQLAEHNNGFRFLLTIIDVFSKYAYVIPLKSKTSVAVKKAIENLLQQVKPRNIQSDKGNEFYNTQLQSLFKRHNINHYSAEGDHKASVVERFNRTLKNKMFWVFTYRKSYRYDDVLQSLVKSYNDSKHRSIGMAPSKVTRDLEPQIFKKLYGYTIKNSKVSLNKGDVVRISKANKSFRRGYLPGWSDEVFTVSKAYSSHPTTFELQDLKSEAIKGRFYAEELQKISKRSDDYWLIEKVLKTKGRGPKKEYYVKWKGFDNRFNSWVKATWMK
ncbi:Putative uncharacterized transposon-derived protein F54H12.3 [Araneus ventricosus]|uniref:Uncharacterized transposon-derived protein F54H12.3 n=4 Tax=Araneus ventricosus TaxID=182803 RepID=A0A4Y2U1L7_ARAVE|nr:Putative uncharacterized transposon-derived protein F54H12.3 [Araneus ventricosus]